MKFLTAEEFFGESANKRLTGMSAELEDSRIKQCLSFIKELNA